LYEAFKELDHPLDALGGKKYVVYKIVKNKGRGRPTKRKRLSKVAHERIFSLVAPTNKEPKPLPISVNKKGKFVIPSLKVEKKLDEWNTKTIWLPAEEAIRLREKKIGKTIAYQLKDLIDLENDPAKIVDYVKETEVAPTNRWGRPPKHQYVITETGFEKLFADQNENGYTIDYILRCNDPMQCPNPDCRICAKAGYKTCWDQKKD
jgi:hypothetical protein